MTDNERNESISALRQLLAMCDFVDQYGDSIDADPYFNAVETAIESLNETRWIPVKWHEIMDEERELEGYPKDWEVFMDCEMPCDGQEILVQTKNGYIILDICYEDGEFSLDSGCDWIEDIAAWMPLPEPWKDGEEE